MAQTHQLWIVGGGIAEHFDSTHTFNTCLVVSPAGTIAGCYRKIHLFDVDIPDGPTLRESDSTQAGSELQCIDTPVGKLGLSICYDLRFPELYRSLAMHHGAQLFVIPAAFTKHTGAAHWKTLLRAAPLRTNATSLRQRKSANTTNIDNPLAIPPSLIPGGHSRGGTRPNRHHHRHNRSTTLARNSRQYALSSTRETTGQRPYWVILTNGFCGGCNECTFCCFGGSRLGSGLLPSLAYSVTGRYTNFHLSVFTTFPSL